MRFGAVVGNDPRTIAVEAGLLEASGFETVWFPEVPLVGYGDPHVCMTAAALATSRIQLGTFISPAGTRPSAMLLTQFATLNQLAPGRVRVGFGSGSFSRALLNLPVLKVAELERELVEWRSLLDRGEADVNGAPIRYYDWERPSLNRAGITLEIAAHGPRGGQLAGRYGDAIVTAGEVHPPKLRALYDQAVAEARAAGRDVDRFTFTAEVGPLCVLRPGESLSSPRVVQSVQPIISGHFLFFLMAGMQPDDVDPGTRDGYGRFLSWVCERHGEDPKAQFKAMCDRYLGRNPEHDQFVTPDVIRSHTITGPMDEVVERLRDIASAGVTDVAVMRALDQPLGTEGVSELIELRDRVG